MSRSRTRRRRFPARRLVYLALFILAALVGSSFVRVTLQDNALGREAAGVRGEIAVLELQQAGLKAEVAIRASDAYVEQKARDLGYVKPGEGLASVRDANPATDARAVTTASLSSRIERWLALFFHP